MSLKPESIFSTTLAKLGYGAVVLLGSGWWAKGQINSVLAEISAVRATQAAQSADQEEQEAKIQAIDKKLDSQFVTWPIAKLYASETRRANSSLPLYLPDVDEYQKANRTN